MSNKRIITIQEMREQLKRNRERLDANRVMRLRVAQVAADSQDQTGERAWMLQVMDSRARSLEDQIALIQRRIDEQEVDNLNLGVLFLGGEPV
jgi:hypothetical protein